MKRKILLVDDSLTVQKVVSLTLDKTKFDVFYSRNRTEAVRAVVDNVPDLIFLSDQVGDVAWQSFPKEMESWLGRGSFRIPLCVLITSQDLVSARHFVGVLHKPFTPQALQAMVSVHLPSDDKNVAPGQGQTYEEDRMHKIFNEAFADEGKLTQQTLQMHVEEEEPTMLIDKSDNKKEGTLQNLWEDSKKPVPVMNTASTEAVSELWGTTAPSSRGGDEAGISRTPLLNAEDSMAYKSVLENQVKDKLGAQDLEGLVDKALQKILPPIVERMVQERLDKLLAVEGEPNDLKL